MTVTGTSDFPDRHASLSDGSTTIEFIFTDGNGEKNERAFKAEPYPRTALKTTQGESKYSDLEPPYFAIAQDDFTGGRGNEDHESDTSRYYDGWRVDTSKEGGVVLGGRETYSTGYRDVDQALPGSVTFQASYGTTRYLAINFTSTVAYTVTQCEIWVKRVGDPGGLQVELWSNSGGEPNAMLETETISAANLTTDTVSLFKQFDWPNLTALDGSSDYWVVIDGGSGTDATNHWAIGCDAATAGLRSSDSSTWTATTYSPYYRITPEKTTPHYIFFEYKGGFYAAEVQQSGNSELYILGDRGVADSSASNTLVDGTKSGSWTTNEFANGIVLITNGKGVDQPQPWRTISSNTTTTLTVSQNWDITPTNDTEYVIVGVNKWRNVTTLNVAVNSVAVVGGWVYFTSNDDTETMDRMIEYNDGGTFTRQVTSDVPAWGKKLLGLVQDEDEQLFYTLNHSKATTNERKGGSRIHRASVPEYYHADADLFYSLGTLVDTSEPWDALDTTNVTVIGHGKYTDITCAAGFTTGVAAVKNLDTPIDITAARQIRATVYSTVAVDAGEWELAYDDVENLDETNQPSKVFHLDEEGGSPTYTDLPKTYDGIAANQETVTIETDDRILIGYSKPFNKVYVDMGGTVNAVTASVTVNYFNGSSFTTVSGVSDGTASGGASMAVDGTISWTLPKDWKIQTINSVEAYWASLDWNANLSASIIIKRFVVTRQNNVTIDIPALEAAKWHTVVMALPVSPYPAATDQPDESAIRSIGVNVATDPNPSGIKGLYLKDIEIGGSPHNMLHQSAKDLDDEIINGLEAYSGNVDDPVKNPWVLTNRGVYEYRTQDNDELVPLPLGELSTLASPDNGIGHCVNSTYLYFNIGQKIQRYFNRTLDDVGPDRDEGLPSGRQGVPRNMASYAGSIFASIDAGDSGTSSVLALHGTAWHEVYRAPQSGERIKSIGIQAMPSTIADRLWISMGSDIVWIPISLNPYNDSSYTYTHESTLTTSWIYAGMKDVQKLWKSLKVFAENVDSNYFVEVDYQVDTDTTWTEIGKYDTAPVEEIDIASTLPQAKRIRYRLRVQSNDVSKTPRIKALVTEGVAFVPVKYQYAWNFKVAQDTENIDQWGVFDDTLTSLQQYNQLVSWANTGQPLTFRHHSAVYDNKTVFLNPTSVSPLRIVDEGPEGSQEVHLASITCIEA